MIIGYHLNNLFNGLVVNGQAVKYTYGNKDALDKFIALSDKRQAQKYPLIFYVVNPVREYNGIKYCETDIVIMNNSNISQLSNARTEDSFIAYIEPTYQELVKVLKSNNLDESDRKDKFSYVDIPNYGITAKEGYANDNNRMPKSKSTKSIITDHVDARIVKVKLKININCII
jgi:hypothetical protein